MPKGKAQADAKAQHTCKYVSILRRFATPPLGIRCIFEIGSNKFADRTANYRKKDIMCQATRIPIEII